MIQIKLCQVARVRVVRNERIKIFKNKKKDNKTNLFIFFLLCNFGDCFEVLRKEKKKFKPETQKEVVNSL